MTLFTVKCTQNFQNAGLSNTFDIQYTTLVPVWKTGNVLICYIDQKSKRKLGGNLIKHQHDINEKL